MLFLLNDAWKSSVHGVLVSLGILVLAILSSSRLTYHFPCLFAKGLPVTAACNVYISFQIGAVCSPHGRVRPLKSFRAAALLAGSR